MKTETSTEEVLKIPLDMAMDIFTIIVKEQLKHEIIDLIPNRGQVVLEVRYDPNTARSQKAVTTIKNLLADYQHYRSWENEELNWREE